MRPVCPRCLRNSGIEAPIEINSVLREERGAVIEGVLVCSNPQCMCEFPVIDGIPIIVPDVRSYLSQNLLSILTRYDLDPDIETILGDCAGPGSDFDAQRQHLSTYGFDHYGDLDADEAASSGESPCSVLRLLEEGLSVVPHPVDGPVIDIGCAVGRTSFELAGILDRMVLGVDLNFHMLRVGTRVLQEGIVRYPKRSVGLVYDRREFPASFTGAPKVDFWACDALALPFPPESFSLAASLNVLDCLTSPYDHLVAIHRLLVPGGNAIVSSPYDWSSSSTPLERWLGGHSQRSARRGLSESMLRSLLTEGGHPQAIDGLRILSEFEAVPWSLRLHARGTVKYQVHMVAVRKDLEV